MMEEIYNEMKNTKISIKGSQGMGKTYTLKKLAEITSGIYLPRLTPRKTALTRIISHLFNAEIKEVKQLKAEEMVEILASLPDQDTFIFLDDLDRYTPRELELFEILDEKFNVVFSFTEMRKIKKYVYQTKIISLKPLSRKTMEKLLDEHGINDPSMRIQIIERSAGIPGVFFSILKNPESIKTISSHPPKKIDMTWILLSIISFIIIMRFIALGTNDTEKYILAGILYGLSFMFRPFIYKSIRTKD